jgi:hypothetical protein
MVKALVTIFVSFALLLLICPAQAGPGGCADCSDEEVCTDCREFYAEIARKVPEKGARVWGWVLAGLTAVAFIAVFIHVVRGNRRPSTFRRRT